MTVSYLNDAFFSRLETLELHLRTNLSGFFGGKHLVNTYGQTVEFADYREYQLGDDIRRIDWNLFSRFEKYYLKLFTDERQMHTQIFLDCSASMQKPDSKKAAYAIGIAAGLGFLTVHNMDKLSIRLMSEEHSENPFGTIVGKTSFFRTVSELDKTTFGKETDLEKAITSCVDVGNNDGLTIIISDFFTESDWKKAVDYLCYKKRQVMLIQVLTPDELDPLYNGRVNLIDVESQDLIDGRNLKIKIDRGMQDAYSKALKDYNDSIRQFCVSRDADFITVNTDTPVEEAIFGQLLKIGMIR